MTWLLLLLHDLAFTASCSVRLLHALFEDDECRQLLDPAVATLPKLAPTSFDAGTDLRVGDDEEDEDLRGFGGGDNDDSGAGQSARSTP